MNRVIDLFKTIFGFAEVQPEMGELNEDNIDKIGLPSDMIKAIKESWKVQNDLEKNLESDGENKKTVQKANKIINEVAKSTPSKVRNIER